MNSENDFMILVEYNDTDFSAYMENCGDNWCELWNNSNDTNYLVSLKSIDTLISVICSGVYEWQCLDSKNTNAYNIKRTKQIIEYLDLEKKDIYHIGSIDEMKSLFVKNHSHFYENLTFENAHNEFGTLIIEVIDNKAKSYTK